MVGDTTYIPKITWLEIPCTNMRSHGWDTTYIPEITWLEIPCTNLRSHGWRYNVHTWDHMVGDTTYIPEITWLDITCTNLRSHSWRYNVHTWDHMVGDTTYIPEITWLEIPCTHLRSHGWRYHVHTLDHMVEIPRTLESITYFAHWMNVWCSSICLSRPFCKLSVLVSRGACRTVKGLEYQYSNTIEPTKVVFKIMVFYMWHIRCNKNMFQLLWYDSLNNSLNKIPWAMI